MNRRWRRSAPKTDVVASPDGEQTQPSAVAEPSAAAALLAADQLEASGQLLAAGYFAIDLDSDTAALDQRCREILGLEGSEFSGRELAAWALTSLHGDDLPDVREALEQAVRTGGQLAVRGRLTREPAGSRPEGRTRWLEVAARVRHTAQATSISGALVDCTDDRLLEERWLRGQKREALGVLAAGIAHDLNNVMGAIIGNAELAQNELKLGRSPTESVAEIQQASRRAGDVLHRLLKFGRETTSKRVATSLSELAVEACTLLTPTTGPAVQIITPRPCVDDLVLGDPVQLHQLIINLITNAAYVLESEGGTITVSVQPGPPHQSTLQLAVADTGSGIPDEVLPKIFEPFFTTKGPEEGTGLGLAAASSIAENHGGTLTVETNVGGGTTFTLSLPKADSAAHKDPINPAVSTVTNDQRRGKIRVAFVAADPEQRFTARVSMPSFGCIPIVFATAAEVIEAIRRQPQDFDALVSDAAATATPRDLIQKARKLRPDLPIILLAGPDAAVTHAQADNLNVDAWIPRPYPPSELCTTLLRLTELR